MALKSSKLVFLGKISRNPALTAPRISPRLLKANVMLSTSSLRPPRTLQPFKIVLRASADFLDTRPSASLKPVNVSLASSNVPKTVRKVCAQPEPTLSRRVPRSCVRVLTDVADSLPSSPAAMSCLAASSLKPLAVSSSRVDSPAMPLSVVKRTSLVSHESTIPSPAAAIRAAASSREAARRSLSRSMVVILSSSTAARFRMASSWRRAESSRA